MKQTFYIKRGRRYLPVHEYDSDLMSSLPAGHHLVSVVPGGTSTLMRVNPAHAAVLAALQPLQAAMTEKLAAAQQARLGPAYRQRPITEKARRLWDALKAELHEDFPAHYESPHTIVEEVLNLARQLATKDLP